MKKIPIINQTIKNRRKELKITQEEFKNIINKGIATIKRYDTGDIIPENTLILICDKLSLSITDLCLKQKKENESENTNFYQEIIKKYAKALEKKAIPELYKKYVEKICREIVLLYEVLHDESFNELDFPSMGEDLKNWDFIDYEAIPDYRGEKIFITVKQIKLSCQRAIKQEKTVDIFEVGEIENIFDSLTEFFNMKLLVLRMRKLRGERIKNNKI